MNAIQPVFELMDFPDLAEDIGQNIKLARAAKGWRQEDLSKASGASLQAIKNLEGGGNVEFKTFLKAIKALGMGRAVWEGCKPAPQTLDELERMEHARSETARVRLTG
jgi:transcriptional regulator with XRE-family HTH domain